MWAVRFEDVTKRHRAKIAGQSSLRGEIADVLRRRRGHTVLDRPRAAPALDHVSFEIEAGSSVALIGANGAGKTTALRLMSRIIYPSEGRIRVRGRVGALLEVGSGVHPELSGRENIWLYGSIIGIPRAEIRRRFDDILDFAELGHVIDRPAKFYSSGMQLRLGFAIATFLEPHVLLVDESLATADLNFQLKCIDRMATLVRQGTTLLFVSHELAAVETLCSRGILLERGVLVHDGDIHETVVQYKRRLASARAERAGTDPGSDTSTFRIVRASCVDDDGRPAMALRSGDAVTVRVVFESRVAGARPVVDLRLADPLLGDLVVCTSAEAPAPVTVGEGVFELSCRFADLPLRARQYTVTIGVREAGHSVAEPGATEVTPFRVEDRESPSDLTHGMLAGGPLQVDRHWEWSAV